MRTILFNQHIDKVGIEFEGFYSSKGETRLREMQMSGLLDIGTDGSLRYDERTEGLESLEVRTIPLNENNLNIVLKEFNKMMSDADYVINKSCGLHFHISTKGKTYSMLCNPQFFKSFVDMMKEKFSSVYKSRFTNRYCMANLETLYNENHIAKKDIEKRHFHFQSYNRYSFINYCYNKHGTVEFRAYGGSKATIEGLADCIQSTLNLIKVYGDKKKRMQRHINVAGKELLEKDICTEYVISKTPDLLRADKDIPLTIPSSWFAKDAITYDLSVFGDLLYGVSYKNGLHPYLLDPDYIKDLNKKIDQMQKELNEMAVEYGACERMGDSIGCTRLAKKYNRVQSEMNNFIKMRDTDKHSQWTETELLEARQISPVEYVRWTTTNGTLNEISY